jgi:oligoribonuclease NrnB/cAMP/cGMP phosphodiesterase (DHH superfamily)
MNLILYHNNCPDGWCAAYICKLKYPEAALMPLNHGLSPEALDELMFEVRGKDVIMVDYSLRTRELNDQLNSLAKSFRILDHHKTAQAVLEGASYATFDMKRSGAGLAWDYLFGKDSVLVGNPTPQDPFGVLPINGSRPWWVDYTEDQDLWNWQLDHSEEVNAYLMVQPRTVETWNEITKIGVDDAYANGVGVRQYIEYYTRSVVAEAQEGVLHFQTGTLESEDSSISVPTWIDYRTAVLNIPYAGVSEAGNALCKAGYPIALLWFERGDGVIQFSLRGDGSVDVSAIAKSFGGGGHHNAAGFQLSLDRGRVLVDRILGRQITPGIYIQ